MKRYISLIALCILTLFVMTFLFYILLRQDNSYITYIKLQVNPSFVMGINDDKKVVFYNALNDDGNKYNLLMFQGKSLSSAIKIFIEKLGNAKENKNEINLTVMTKNNLLEREILTIIEKEVREFDQNYVIVSHEPTSEELERYSNETIYNMVKSLTNEDLKVISREVYKKLVDYTEDKISKLNLLKLKPAERTNVLKEKYLDGYFNDYLLSGMEIDKYRVVLLERSSYNISFEYNVDNSFNYNIILNLELEYEKNELKHIVEVYRFSYELGEDKELIKNLKTSFYTF